MGTRTRFSHGLFSAVLGFGLLSLVFLGSPGCGCGDDDLRPPSDDGPDRCCCTFVWGVPREAAAEEVEITFENEDDSLDAEATPSVFTTPAGVLGEVTFVVCVNEEHLIGDQLEIVFTDTSDSTEYGRGLLIYDVRCEPSIEPLSDIFQLDSTDCGDPPEPCCCEFEWIPGANHTGDVEIVVQGASPGLNPTVTPSTFTGVAPGVTEIFDVCVDDDHLLGAQFDLVIQQQGGGGILGSAILRYNKQCEPDLVPTTAFEPLILFSPECGIDPALCCCNFEWVPPVDYTGTANLTVEGASTGLGPVINPVQLVVPESSRDPLPFTVCVNENHALLDEFTLVITDDGAGSITGELLRVLIVYRIRCDAHVATYTGIPGQALTSTDCGETLTCCCVIDWEPSTDPDWNPPGSPWTAVIENADPSLEPATVVPANIPWMTNPPALVTFNVCVNMNHTDGAAMDLVIYGPDPTGGSTPTEIARVPMDWTPNCVAVLGDPSSAGGHPVGIWINHCETPPN